MTDPTPLRLRHTSGSIRRRGTWTVPASVELTRRMGSTELNFAAAFESMRTVIDVDMIGGSIDLKVPAGVAVESEIATTLASYQDHRKASAMSKAEPRGVIVLRGRAVWDSEISDAAWTKLAPAARARSSGRRWSSLARGRRLLMHRRLALQDGPSAMDADSATLVRRRPPSIAPLPQ